MKYLKYTCLFLLFFFLNIFEVYAVNCDKDKATIYFNDPKIVSEYSGKFYCSDIMYLLYNTTKKLSLEEYNKLYPSWIPVEDISYLRQVGITPDIADEFIEKDLYEKFMSDDWFEKTSDKKNEDDSNDRNMKNFIQISIRGAISALRKNTDYIVVTDDIFESDKDLIGVKDIGDILRVSSNYRSVLEVIDYKDKEEVDLHKTTGKQLNPYLNYNTLIDVIPLTKLPVMMQGNKLYNTWGKEVAVLEFHPDGDNLMIISFSDSIFHKEQKTIVKMFINKFENKLRKDLESYTSCGSYCSVILSLINITSYIFNIMYKHFYKYIVIFLIVFMALFIVFEFLKGFSNIPFTADFSVFPKNVAKKFQLILVTFTILLVPVPKLFSWTVEPVLDLTMAISSSIINIGTEGKYTCDPDTYIDNLYANKESVQGTLPPIVAKYNFKELQEQKSSTNKINSLVDQSGDRISIMSDKTKGRILCFMIETQKYNGKYQMLGKMLMLDPFKLFWSKSENGWIAFLLGIFVFFAYGIFSLRIAFYLIEGILQFLKLAIVWPFSVFGHVFNLTGMTVSIKSLVDMAKNFGMTMITLSIFSLFNMTFVNAFYFTKNKEGKNIVEIFDDAIERGDADFLIQNMGADILYVTKFLFIIYCLYYVYSQLGKFASYYGGSIGSSNSFEQVKNLIKGTGFKFFGTVIEKGKDFADKRSEKKKKK